MTGSIGILNVGAGDTKLTFDKSNPAELIRSGRIVRDMLRRGYALLIEVPDNAGGITHARVLEFREDVSEYIIADFDPIVAEEPKNAQVIAREEEAVEPEVKPEVKRGRKKSVPATGTTGVAVARSAGG